MSSNNPAQPTWLTRLAKSVLIRGSNALTAVLVVLGAIGFYLGSGVELKLSLTDLLPDDHPAVVKFTKLTEVVGGVGFFTIVLSAEDGKSHIEAAPRVIEALLKTPLMKSASFEREKRFFVDRMLYYMTVDQLQDMQGNLSKQIAVARGKVFDLGLWEEEPKEKTKPVFDDKMTKLAKESAGVSPFLTSPDGKHLLIMAKPSFDSTDLAKTKALVAFSENVLKSILPANVRYRFAERYYNKVVETEMIQSDIYVLGSISLLIIGLLIWWYLRSFRATVLIFVPVFIGLGLTMGITALTIGHINIVTGFLIGILSGLGVDYSIHMFLRYRLEQREPSSNDPDIAYRTLSSTGHSVFVGALAASVAFFTLCFSDFRAFSEFGLICGTGILCVFFSLIATFKCLSRFFEKATLSKSVESRTGIQMPVLPIPKGLTAGVVITVALIALGSQVSFLYDFDRMMKHSKEMEALNTLVDDVYGRSAVPSALSTETKQEALDVEKLIRDKYMPNTVNDLISGASIVPDDQTDKREILDRMQESVGKLKDKWIADALGVPGDAVRRWVSAEPFTFEQIPGHVQDSLRGSANKGFLIYIYPAIKLGTYDNIKIYSAMFKDIEKNFPDILSGSDAVVFSDILDLIKHDGGIILAMIFIAVGLFIWLNVRKFDDTMASYLPLLIALPVGMGLMVLFGVQFNILNITIIPSFVAMGIDVPIHLVHRAREVRSGFKAARDIAPSVNLALATAAVGFGVLIFAKAGVLRSLGWIALLGTAAIWWTGLVVLPAVLEWLWFRRAREASRDTVAATGKPQTEVGK
jgi:uncharacterized protein